MVREAGGQARAMAQDTTEEAQWQQVMASIREQEKRLDIVLNNAGVSNMGRLLKDTSLEQWRFVNAANVEGVYLGTKYGIELMEEAGNGGSVVNISSIYGKVGAVGSVAYNASKHGVMGLARTVAVEYARAGITSNCICPGPVKTVMNNARVEYDAQRKGVDHDEYEAGLTPIGGRLVPEDISPLAVYLASDDAKMVTGQSYNVDGGIVMS